MKKVINEPLMTPNEHRKILGLDPVKEVNPVPMVPRMADRVPGVHRTNCPNCCAVITGPICEYCGTRFGGYDPGAGDDQTVVIPLNITAEQAAEAFRSWNESMFRSGGV